MFTRFGVVLSALLFVLTLPAQDASAQIDNRLAVGMSVTTRIASSSSAAGSADVGFELRLGHERQGWVPQVSFFNWFDTDVQQSVAGRSSELGQLRIRPIMAGYGYTWIRGRTALTADVVGGFAINSFDLNAAAATEYQARLGATNLRTSASNTFAVKPEVQAWYDLNNRIGLKLNGGYLIARPSVTITSTLGEDTRPVHADTFLITFGVVYSLF
jgi:hypothetical protein